jgi:hypothetical protein
MLGARQPEPTRKRLPAPGVGAGPNGTDGFTHRSSILRRAPRTTFHLDGSTGLRLRRQRRVCASFSGIPDLARNGTH